MGLNRPAIAFLGLASAVVASGTPAFANGADPCAAHPASGFAQPVVDELPIRPWSGPADIAAFVLPFALMAEDARGVRRGDDLHPYGYYLGPDAGEILAGFDWVLMVLSGFYGTTFVHCRSRAVVIVYDGLGSAENFDPRDFVSAIVRQVSGGESQLALAFFDGVAALYPGYAITVTGHSYGGGFASYVSAVRNVPSIIFNPALTEAALLNSGENQLVIRVTGDILSDPDMAPLNDPFLQAIQAFFDSPADIRGQMFRIEPTQDYGPMLRLHWISVIIAELRRIMAAPRR